MDRKQLAHKDMEKIKPKQIVPNLCCSKRINNEYLDVELLFFPGVALSEPVAIKSLVF